MFYFVLGISQPQSSAYEKRLLKKECSKRFTGARTDELSNKKTPANFMSSLRIPREVAVVLSQPLCPDSRDAAGPELASPVSGHTG